MYNNFEISLVAFMPNITANHAITYTYTADHHSAVREIPWDWESAERRRLFSAQYLGVLSCPVVRVKSGKRRARESLLVTSHLTSRERLGLRLGHFLLIRVYCSCCCRRCYLQRSYPSEYKRDRTNAFITISIEVSTTNGYGCSSC